MDVQALDTAFPDLVCQEGMQAGWERGKTRRPRRQSAPFHDITGDGWIGTPVTEQGSKRHQGSFWLRLGKL
jgi:hypothetical protein